MVENRYNKIYSQFKEKHGIEPCELTWDELLKMDKRLACALRDALNKAWKI